MEKLKEPIFELDEEEQALSDSFDRGEWKSVPHLNEEIAQAKQAAKNYFNQKEKVTLRVQTADMHRIKKVAAEKGLRPHTYLASLVHQIAAGSIKE